MKSFFLVRALRAFPVLGAVCIFTLPPSGALEREAVQLFSDQLDVELDSRTGALLSATNRLTGARKTAEDVAFTVLTDRGVIGSDRCRLVSSTHDRETATFEFESKPLSIKLEYLLRSLHANFVEKLLTVTNNSDQPVVLAKIVLEEVAFDPPAAQVHFHRAGLTSDRPVISPDVPINLFLRDPGGGMFMGIENPYFGLTKFGNRLSLQFSPRWLLQPKQSFASDPAFLGVYKNEGIYAFKPISSAAAGKPPATGAQELLDWGEVWAMQDFMREALTHDRPPGKGYCVVYNACGGMEYLWRLREAPAKFTAEGGLIPGEHVTISGEEREFAKHFSGTSSWTREIVHGEFRPGWIEPFRILIDHLAEIGHVEILHPGTVWLGNSGFWDATADRAFLGSLKMDTHIEANPYWLQTLRHARSNGIDFYGFECVASGYFPDRKDLKYVGRDGNPTGWNCYADPTFVNWHREAVDRAITEYHLPWWQWDEGWADVNGGECYAANHSHPSGSVSYAVYHNIQQTCGYLKDRHPGLWLVGISVFQHDCPWILRTVNESVTYADPWYAHNYLFMPPGKGYVGDYFPRTGSLEYDLLHHLSLADHMDLGQPVWFADPARCEAAQQFWRKWLSWADTNFEYLRARRDLFGTPHSGLEGSAHIVNSRGFIFLFNSSETKRAGNIPLNHWIGLTQGERFAVGALYPDPTRDYGVYARGDELVVGVPAKQALVLQLASTEAPRSPSRPPAGVEVEKAFLSLKDILVRLTERDLWSVP